MGALEATAPDTRFGYLRRIHAANVPAYDPPKRIHLLLGKFNPIAIFMDRMKLAKSARACRLLKYRKLDTLTSLYYEKSLLKKNCLIGDIIVLINIYGVG